MKIVLEFKGRIFITDGFTKLLDVLVDVGCDPSENLYIVKLWHNSFQRITLFMNAVFYTATNALSCTLRKAFVRINSSIILS